MYFHDRLEAADALAEALSKYRGRRPLVLGIPRGGVPMARRIAEKLDGDLDVVLVRKLLSPTSPEVAIGSVGEDGDILLGPGAAEIPDRDIEEQSARQFHRIRQLRGLLTPHRTPVDVAGRTCIVVDDGIATGHTILGAVHSLAARSAGAIVAAAPVAATQPYWKLLATADHVVCLYVEDHFMGVGRYYDDFPEVTDGDVIAALEAAPVHAPSLTAAG